MTIQQLECFIMLANSLNFTQAAEALFITQPALSRTISTLEQEIGVQLLDRNTRNVTLTPAGESFLGESRKVLAAYNESITKATMAKRGYAGRLVIGYTQDAFEPVAADLLAEFHARYPEIFTDFREMSHIQMHRTFEKGGIDVIIDEDASAQKGCQYLPFQKSVKCAVVSHRHPLANRKTIAIEELKEENFVLMARGSSFPVDDTFIVKCRMAGTTPRFAEEIKSLASLLMVVACNYGVTILPDHIAPVAAGRVKFIPMEGEQVFHRAMVWKEDNENPCLPRFIETIRHVVEAQGLEIKKGHRGEAS